MPGLLENIQQLPIPHKPDWKFDAGYLESGSPILYRYRDNTHLFNALVQDCGPFILTITNGHQTTFIEVGQVISGEVEIHTLFDFEASAVMPCEVFDVDGISVGSIFVDQDNTSFIITGVEPFSLLVSDHQDEIHLIYAETFFGLDKDEVDSCYMILPPVMTAGPGPEGEGSGEC